jgi:hypothetical protein
MVVIAGIDRAERIGDGGFCSDVCNLSFKKKDKQKKLLS